MRLTRRFQINPKHFKYTKSYLKKNNLTYTKTPLKPVTVYKGTLKLNNLCLYKLCYCEPNNKSEFTDKIAKADGQLHVGRVSGRVHKNTKVNGLSFQW